MKFQSRKESRREVKRSVEQPDLAVLIIASVFVAFLIQGVIARAQTITCALGAATGGFVGARVAKRMLVPWLRGVVITVGIALTLIYTGQYWIKPFTS